MHQTTLKRVCHLFKKCSNFFQELKNRADNTYITLTFDLETLFKIIVHFSLKHSVAKCERYFATVGVYMAWTRILHINLI